MPFRTLFLLCELTMEIFPWPNHCWLSLSRQTKTI